MAETELTPQAKEALRRELQQSLLQKTAGISAVIASLLGIVGYLTSKQVGAAVRNTVDQELGKSASSIRELQAQVEEVQDEALQAAAELKAKIAEVDDIRERIPLIVAEAEESSAQIEKALGDLSSRVASLTTTEITKKLVAVEGRLEEVGQQLNNLNQIVTPETAAQVLNVERMNQEILDRKKFEDRLGADLAASDARQVSALAGVADSISDGAERITNLEDDVRDLFYWILGTVLSVAAGLLAAFGYLGKQVGKIFELVPRRPAEQAPDTLATPPARSQGS